MEEDGKTVNEPHAWNSMKNGEVYANNVMNALIAADPASCISTCGGADYVVQLQKLDRCAATRFAAIPLK